MPRRNDSLILGCISTFALEIEEKHEKT